MTLNPQPATELVPTLLGRKQGRRVEEKGFMAPSPFIALKMRSKCRHRELWVQILSLQLPSY